MNSEQAGARCIQTSLRKNQPERKFSLCEIFTLAPQPRVFPIPNLEGSELMKNSSFLHFFKTRLRWVNSSNCSQCKRRNFRLLYHLEALSSWFSPRVFTWHASLCITLRPWTEKSFGPISSANQWNAISPFIRIKHAAFLLMALSQKETADPNAKLNQMAQLEWWLCDD